MDLEEWKRRTAHYDHATYRPAAVRAPLYPDDDVRGVKTGYVVELAQAGREVSAYGESLAEALENAEARLER